MDHFLQSTGADSHQGSCSWLMIFVGIVAHCRRSSDKMSHCVDLGLLSANVLWTFIGPVKANQSINNNNNNNNNNNKSVGSIYIVKHSSWNEPRKIEGDFVIILPKACPAKLVYPSKTKSFECIAPSTITTKCFFGQTPLLRQHHHWSQDYM